MRRVLLVFLAVGALNCGAKDGSKVCPSIDAYCSQGQACIKSWALASQEATWCVRGADGGLTGPDGKAVRIHPGCGGFNIVIVTGLDNGMIYVYDATTGQLSGIGAQGDGQCLAGSIPASANSLECDAQQSTLVCGGGP
jgi:hypothetical protein